MSNKPKVSIVVPIYGVVKYLHQCVDSILEQTLKDIEVILVDDGSKDKCPQIVDEYAKKDKRVVAIHQPNGGYGRAVNHGIEVATGEYIGIIESDDWIEPTMYEKMYANAKKLNTDITKCGFYSYNSLKVPEEQNKIWKSKYQDLDKAPEGVFSVKEYPLIIAFHASIWANLYRTDFIKGQKVIETRSASYQDFPFMIEAMCRAKRISVVKEALVHYHMEEGQNSSTIRRDARLILMPKQCIEGKRLLKQYGLYDDLKEEFYFHSYFACIGFYKNIYWKYKKEYFQAFHELLAEIQTDNTFKYKFFKKKYLKQVKHIVEGNFIRSLLYTGMIKNIRKFFLSFNVHHRKGCIQLMGIQFLWGAFGKRPAFITLRIGGKNE